MVPTARPMSRAANLLALAPLAAGLGAWGIALRSLEHTSLGTRAVPAALPALWWVAVATLLIGGVLASCARAPRGWLIAAYVGALALVLYGTLPAVLDAPQYAWTYKHIGVVQLIELHGTVAPDVDIYNRWPGFFSGAAALSRLMGVANPVSYAAWSELLFALVDALLVAALARLLLRDARIVGLATIIFTLGDWVGQGYFSPQATVYPLSLAVLLIALRQFAVGDVGRRTMRVIELVARHPQLAADAPQTASRRAGHGSTWSRTAAVAAIVALDAAVVAAHQLTPYVLLLQLGGLAVIGVLRPRWIVVVMAVITLGYLLPNVGFVADHYGLFTTLDPFANAQAEPDTARPVLEPWIDQHAGQLLSLLFLGGAGVASLALARRGRGRSAAPLIVLAAMPVGLLFAQGYGGEASLRTFLFSAPWDAMLMAWAVVELSTTRFVRAAALALCVVVAGLFVPAYFGQTSVNVIPRGEVTASQYFYDHAPGGSLLVQSAANFPVRVGGRYALMRGAAGSDAAPSLLVEGRLAHKRLSAHSISAIGALLGDVTQNVFVVFSTSAERRAEVYALSPPGALQSLERAVAASPLFRLWYRTRDARIYQTNALLLALQTKLDSTRAGGVGRGDALLHNLQATLDRASGRP